MNKLLSLVILTFVMTLGHSFPGHASEGSAYSHLDPKGIVPKTALARALSYYQKNIRHFDNRDYIGIIDYTQPETKKRFYIINMRSGQVTSYLVAHGKGSDPANSGRAKKFSNMGNSNATSVGFMRTAEEYFGKHGKSLRLDGLSKTNSKVRARAVVIHAASYVTVGGRSFGCPAVEPGKIKEVMSKLRNGALIYAYGGQGGV